MTGAFIALYFAYRQSLKDQGELIKIANNALDYCDKVDAEKERLLTQYKSFETAAGKLLNTYKDTLIMSEAYAASEKKAADDIYKAALKAQEAAVSWQKIATGYEEAYNRLLGKTIIKTPQDKKAMN